MKILLVHNYLSTFVSSDLAILRSAHEVRAVCFNTRHPASLLLSEIQTLADVLWADTIFAWFGNPHVLLPFLIGRLLKRNCVVVAGGYDVASLPESGYGNMRPGLRRWIGRWVFRLAHCVLAVSQHTAQQAIQNAEVPPEKIQVIYHGIDPDFASIGQDYGGVRQGVLTVASINRGNLAVKGLETFVQAARSLEDIPFTLVGPWLDDAIDRLRAIAPPNVTISGPLYGEDLMRAMLSAKVYVQISAVESFGMAVAEAMSCGCFPVVTDRGALPEVVGDAGYYVPYGDLPATVDAIRQALDAPPSAAERSRTRVIDHFPLDTRRDRLLQAVESLSNDHRGNEHG